MTEFMQDMVLRQLQGSGGASRLGGPSLSEIKKMNQDELQSLYDRTMASVVDNPNGGAQIYATGVMMLYISIFLIVYLMTQCFVSTTRGKYFNKEFMK